MTNGENMANILLQRLVREVTKLWRGEPSEIKTAWDAYAVCREIYELTNEEEEHDGASERAVCDGGNSRHERRGGDKAMREILFRGKRVRDGEWKFGGFVLPNTLLAPMGGDVYRGDIVYPETVGQFTGLTDKNGKRIFEGDIIIYVGEVCSVKWDDETAKFVLESKNLLCDFEEVWCNRLKSKIEVIGTIHDNPELLRLEEEE